MPPRQRRHHHPRRFTADPTRTGTRAAQPEPRRWVGLRAQRRHLSPGAKPGAPPGCRARVPAGPRSGAAPCPAAQRSGSVRHCPAPLGLAQARHEIVAHRVIIAARLRGHFRFIGCRRPLVLPLVILEHERVKQIAVHVDFHGRMLTGTDGLARCPSINAICANGKPRLFSEM